uniref:6-pyruvoyltetrahydropterin synthase n=1 Tax=Octactis speculum TaxID=3111310 RepID=A0A7S2DNZ9_9STRA
MLPIVHSTAEELAVYIWKKMVSTMGDICERRGITELEITVSESPTQSARFRQMIPAAGDTSYHDRHEPPSIPLREHCCPQFQCTEPSSIRPEPSSPKPEADVN